MTWKDSLSIRIPKIDKQHKQMCDNIDNLYTACSQGKGVNEVLNILNFLESYTVDHFADEEKLQIKINYPKYQQHKESHKEFIKLVSLLRKEIDTSGTSMPLVLNLNKSLSTWLIHHIMSADMELKKYI